MIKFLRYSVIALLVLGLAMPFVYTPGSTFPFVFGKGIFFSVLVEIMVLLYAFLALLSPEDRPKRSALLLTVLCYGAAILIASAAGFDPQRSFWGNHERMSGAFTILHFIAYFLVARSVLKSKRDWQWLFGAFLLTSVVMAALALIEHANGLFVSRPGGRVWATLGNYIYLGVYMLFAMFVAAYLFIETKNLFWRILLGAVAILDFYILLLTETRASLLAVLLSFLVIPFIAAWRKRGRTRKLAIAGAMVIIALGVGFYLARDTQFVSSIPGVRRIVTTSLLGGGNRTRLIAWDIALESWKDKWLFGWGPENFYAAFNYHYRPESLLYSYYETWFDRAHNSVLDMLSMTGVVGTLLALGVYAAAAWTVFLRVRRERLTAIQGALFLLFLGAYFFQNLFAFDALSGFLLFYLLIAFIDADPSAQAGSSEKSGKIPVLGLLAFGAPLIAFTAWLVLVNFNMWRANRENLEAISLARYGRFEEAAARHALAMSRNSPHAPEIRADFAREAAQLMGRVPKGKENAALALMQTAVNELRINVDEGKDVYDAIVLSQVLMATGNPQLLSEAEMILRDALPLSPKRQQLLYTLAKVLILEKRFDEAIALAQNIVADESRVGESHWVLALALSEAGKKEESWQAVIAALKNNYQLRDANDEGFVMSLGSKFGAPKEALPLLVYAELEAARGASSSAREHANRVLRLDPSLQERVETLLKKLGN